MMLALALFAALTAMLSTPNVEPQAFVVHVLTHCEPVRMADFLGCEASVPAPGEDERDYAGWSHGEAVAGP
jgi:hypothetical protein